MAKKKAKRKTAKKKPMTAKFTCPACNCNSSMRMPKTTCKTSCKCPCCKKNVKAKDCCIFCDYSNKTCCACK